MYEAFYGLKEKPFSLNPDPSFLYLSKNHSLALTMLNYALTSDSGISVITGEVGSGKTTLIRKILQDIDEDTNVGLISNTYQAIGELLKWVLMAFDLDYRGKEKTELYQCFVDFLIKEYAAKRRTVLIIDEAQNLDIETLEELRMLSNINADKFLVLQLLLVGQPELLETMRRRELRQLAQRVLVDYHLKALSGQETLDYIRYRVKTAGGTRDLIDTYACAAVFYHTGGIPRLINVLCDYALLYGYAEERKQVDLPLMLDVIRDKLKGGIFPIRQDNVMEADLVRDEIQKKINIDISLGSGL